MFEARDSEINGSAGRQRSIEKPALAVTAASKTIRRNGIGIPFTSVSNIESNPLFLQVAGIGGE
jgi:hypothetical protein